MYGNGRPLTKKQLVRLMVGLTLLAAATQTLMVQWGYGAEIATNQPIAITPSAGSEGSKPASAERFIAPQQSFAAGGTLELRAEATIVGPEVRLKQIARWGKRDAAFFEQSSELVLARLDAKNPYRVIDLPEIKKLLADAGVNIGMVRFAGPMSCSVSRSDTKPDTEGALAKWIEAKEQKTLVADAPKPVIQKEVAERAASAEKPAVRSLREILVKDLAVRFNMSIELMQVNFDPKDDRLLNLVEPQFYFRLDPQNIRNLGDVTWAVSIVAGEQSQKAFIAARAQAWQTQAIVNRPISAHAPITADDLQERRLLIDRLPDEVLLKLDQAIGQQTTRDLKPGMVLTARMVESVPMAKKGDIVTVIANAGAIRVKTVVRAMETGARGQRVRVRNETTNKLFDVVLTGPQEAAMTE